MKKVLIAADEVDKWSQLCEGLKMSGNVRPLIWMCLKNSIP